MLGSELIKLMAGGDQGIVALVDAFVGSVKTAQWTLGADGFTYLRQGGTTQGPAWINPQSGMEQFEVKATLLDGDAPPGTFGSWINCTTAPAWGWVGSTATRNADIGIQIRRVSDSVVVGSATITLQVEGLV